MTDIVAILFRWLHIVPALALVGGLVYMRFVLPPSLTAGSSDEFETIRARWSKIVMISSGLLLLSGIYNLMMIVTGYTIGKAFPGNLYHPLFGVKFLLALAVFFLAARLAGRSAGAAQMRSGGSLWLNVTLALAVAVVCLGGVLKMAPREKKAPATAETAFHGTPTNGPNASIAN